MTRGSYRYNRFQNEGVQKNLQTLKNEGATAMDGEFILFANADILFCPNWDEILTGYLREHPDVGAVLPIPVGDSNHEDLWRNDFPDVPVFPDAAWMRTAAAKMASHEGIFEYDETSKSSPFFAVMMSRQLWEKSCGFDERFRFWGSDRELTKRLKIGWGLKTIGLRRCPFYHGNGVSRKEAATNGHFNVAAEWKHRNEVMMALEKGELRRWDALDPSERRSIRLDPVYATIGGTPK